MTPSEFNTHARSVLAEFVASERADRDEIIRRVLDRLKADPKDQITDVFPDEKACIIDALELLGGSRK